MWQTKMSATTPCRVFITDDLLVHVGEKSFKLRPVKMNESNKLNKIQFRDIKIFRDIRYIFDK